MAPERGAQESFSSGQNIAPVYEGWEQNRDGSFNLVFGYLNRNWEEETRSARRPRQHARAGRTRSGAANSLSPAAQPFHLQIRVPKDFGTREIVWTLTSNGKTERAYATLKPDYFIDDSVIMAN